MTTLQVQPTTKGGNLYHRYRLMFVLNLYFFVAIITTQNIVQTTVLSTLRNGNDSYIIFLLLLLNIHYIFRKKYNYHSDYNGTFNKYPLN